MKIIKNRLTLEGTLGPSLAIYDRKQDAILFNENNCYLLLKNSSYESSSKGKLFLYKTSFKFKEISFDDAFNCLKEIKSNVFISNCVEINFLNSITLQNKSEKSLLDYSQKEKEFFSFVLKLQLERNLLPKVVQSIKQKI